MTNALHSVRSRLSKMSHGQMTVECQAELQKDRGNKLFRKDRLGPAIEAYTEAIALCPRRPVYWTNRALCHRKRNDWTKVESDCRSALTLDSESVKAHYMLGLALLQRDHLEEAIVHLEQALDFGRWGKPGNYMVEEIWKELAKAKHLQWERSTEGRIKEQENLRDLCKRLLDEDYARQLNDVMIKSTPTEGGIHLDNDSVTPEIQGSVQGDPELIRGHYLSRVRTLEQVFGKASAPDHPAEVPDYLQCKITMDIFRDPVITPSGITYERAALMEHMRKVGKNDPITRIALLPDQIVPNLAIKEALQSYLNVHGWAYRGA